MNIIGLLFIMGFIGVIGALLLWLIIAYPKRYKKNVNKALQSGVPVKTIEPTILFGAFALVTLIVLNIVLLVSLSNLRQDIANVKNDLSNLSQQQQFMSWDIDDIETAILHMYEDSQWVDRAEYEIVEFTDQGQAVVDVIIRFNRIPVNGTITLVSESDNGIEEIEITSTNTIFTDQIILDIDKEYEFYVMIEDGIVLESEDLFRVDVNRIISNSKKVDFEEEVLNNGDLMGYLTIKNDYTLHQDLAFVSVNMVVTLNEQVVDTETVSTPDYVDGTFEYYEFTVNWGEYGNGIVTVAFIATDGFGNEYFLFGEGFEIEMD